MNSIENTVKF